MAMARASSGPAYPERFYTAAAYAGFDGSHNSTSTWYFLPPTLEYGSESISQNVVISKLKISDRGLKKSRKRKSMASSEVIQRNINIDACSSCVLYLTGVVSFHFLDLIGCLPNGLRLAGLYVIGFFVDWICRRRLTQAAWEFAVRCCFLLFAVRCCFLLVAAKSCCLLVTASVESLETAHQLHRPWMMRLDRQTMMARPLQKKARTAQHSKC
ncbi:hypothetical protein NC652_015413 [Populus alba x Populus x berolinensis]|nr:hypothetical protein NC652_015413 [Populus alba x Populus x berolinensis]